MPLTKDRNTFTRSGDQFNHPVAAGVIIYAGALVCLDTSGNAVPGTVSTTLKALGRADEYVDNSAGIAGVRTVNTRPGIFLFKNDGSITQPDVKNNAYIVDDETVADNDGTGTRSLAGQIVAIEPDTNEVWVQFS